MISRHEVSLDWRYAPHRSEENTYSRNHVVNVNGGQSVNVSASVDFKGDPDCADPEQMLVSSLASCHMLTFLAVAEHQGFRVEMYRDNAVGYLEKSDGGLAITRIELSPSVRFAGERVPDEATMRRLHAGAHKNCFIAHSLKTSVTILTDTATI